ncbi:hypothetical protein [Acidiphilium sp. C61]|uniref:hypothetical protein n=1 Tax=Acidiphilium sp. C61 TaxID=1671485 RepID=UPI00157B19A8|nr:hypothetical protein [Acidiphilium sp. C61]
MRRQFAFETPPVLYLLRRKAKQHKLALVDNQLTEPHHRQRAIPPFDAIATRYDKTARNFLAGICLVLAVTSWIR